MEEFKKLWNVGEAKITILLKLIKNQSSNHLPIKQVEKLWDFVAPIHKKMLDIEKNNMKFTLVSRKVYDLSKQVGQGTGDDDLVEDLRKQVILLGYSSYLLFMNISEMMRQSLQGFKECALWTELLELYLEDLKDSECGCPELDEEEPEEYAEELAKKGCSSNRLSELIGWLTK